MEIAQPLRIEDLVDRSRIFNLTDDLLSLSSAHPSYQKKFKHLNNELVSLALKQTEVRQLMIPQGIYFVKGIGMSICSFETLSVYHFIRMSQDPITSVSDHFNETVAAAKLLYNDRLFSTGPLSTPEEDMRLFHFQPNNSLDYRVDHLMQVVQHNRHNVSQFFADMAVVTAAGGNND